MLNLRDIEESILATGKLDGRELEMLRQQLYADGKIDRRKADFLVELHKRVQHINPAFEQFFYQAIKYHVLSNGRINQSSAWKLLMGGASGWIIDWRNEMLISFVWLTC
jgi:hypothetical protein